MMLIFLGLVIWIAVHFVPTLGASMRARWIEQYGEKRYMAGFAIAVLVGLLLIILGWRSSTPSQLYIQPVWGRHLTMLLMLIAVILFGAARAPTNIRRWIRHPQLTSVIMWAVAHLLANGEQRSVLLFGALGVWAIAEIVLINRREGAWVKPDKVAVSTDAKTIGIGLVVYVALVFLHPYISGMPLR